MGKERKIGIKGAEQILNPSEKSIVIKYKGKTYRYKKKYFPFHLPDDTKKIKIKWLSENVALVELIR